MKVKSITLFPHELRAVLDQRQTQLRRPVNFNLAEIDGHRATCSPKGYLTVTPDGIEEVPWTPGRLSHLTCPYGSAGDHLLVRGSNVELKLVEVRVQQLHDISDQDAIAEGVEADEIGHYANYLDRADDAAIGNWLGPKSSFASLWESIHGSRGCGWKYNPVVYALTFEVETEPQGGTQVYERVPCVSCKQKYGHLSSCGIELLHQQIDAVVREKGPCAVLLVSKSVENMEF